MEKLNKKLESKNDKEKKEISESNKIELEKFFKNLNKEEYEKEVDILINEANKIHYTYRLSVDVIKKCKEIIVKNLNEKLTDLPSLLNPK